MGYIKSIKFYTFSILFYLIAFASANAQQLIGKAKQKKEFYFSWGYNKEWYTKSRVKINQPSLNNKYSFVQVKGHDHPGWDEGLFSKALSIPQYNYRVGLLINSKKGIAIEINFDHTKFIFADQNVVIKGIINNVEVNNSISFNKDNGFYYYLNNGANFLLFNIVKRKELYSSKDGRIKIDFLGKAGIGPVIPHVENSFFGKANAPHFQLGGWNIGAEAAIRATFYKNIFLEYSNKIDYARYSNLKIYYGFAKHAFGTYEMILSIGTTFPVGKKH
jgi:hypothetical protein